MFKTVKKKKKKHAVCVLNNVFLQILTLLSLDSTMLYWHKILDLYHNILLLLCTLI